MPAAHMSLEQYVKDYLLDLAEKIVTIKGQGGAVKFLVDFHKMETGDGNIPSRLLVLENILLGSGDELGLNERVSSMATKLRDSRQVTDDKVKTYVEKGLEKKHGRVVEDMVSGVVKKKARLSIPSAVKTFALIVRSLGVPVKEKDVVSYVDQFYPSFSKDGECMDKFRYSFDGNFRKHEKVAGMFEPIPESELEVNVVLPSKKATKMTGKNR